eukprot:TRINITY_DN4853_c1_g2_i1.p2 TRINITY_DN4853_c1_g2~~TRINITY_DN4853_c1_g2_i1.p2  ORF type:complete len:186 (+),score=21.62 TRINITY_DN4853_c1_g2_i1:166-723(+)
MKQTLTRKDWAPPRQGLPTEGQAAAEYDLTRLCQGSAADRRRQGADSHGVLPRRQPERGHEHDPGGGRQPEARGGHSRGYRAQVGPRARLLRVPQGHKKRQRAAALRQESLIVQAELMAFSKDLTVAAKEHIISTLKKERDSVLRDNNDLKAMIAGLRAERAGQEESPHGKEENPLVDMPLKGRE